jgi:hypothetical protein
MEYTETIANDDINELRIRENKVCADTKSTILSAIEILSNWTTKRMCLWKMHPTSYYFFELCNRFLKTLELDELSPDLYFTRFKNNTLNHPREIEYSFVKEMCPLINFDADQPSVCYGDGETTKFKSIKEYVKHYYDIYSKNEEVYRNEYLNHKINNFLPL